MVVFHTSFIRLLELVREERWHDTPECLYHFFTVGLAENIIDSARLVDCSFDKVERTLLQLVRAEREGRVSWHYPNSTQWQEKQRFLQTLQKARQMGASIMPYPEDDNGIYRNEWLMRRFLRNAVMFAD